MILSTHGVLASQIQSYAFLLDLYPSAAASYSLRKLRSAYTGSAIRVRRSSDNTEQDIGFTSANVLDTSTLTSFCSGTNGFVTTWYDQSGNARNATQTTAANQPQIVSSGNVILDNGKPSLSFNGTTNVMSNAALGTVFSGSSIPISTMGIFSKNNTNTEGLALSISNTGNTQPMIQIYRLQSNGKIGFFHRDDGSVQTFIESNNYISAKQYYSFFDSNGSSFNLYYNNSLEISNTYSSGQTTLNTFNIGALVRTTTGSYFGGKIQEIISYPSNQSSNRTGISSNINTYYGIY